MREQARGWMIGTVVWRSDGSAALLAGQTSSVLLAEAVEARGAGLVFLHVRPSDEVAARLIQPGPVSMGVIGSAYFGEWTADEQHLVAAGGLIQPEPWEVIDLREWINELFATNRTVPQLAPLPVPGWVWARGSDGRSYAIDYQGRQAVPITDAWEWTVAPDGPRIAEIDKGPFGPTVKVRPLELPSLEDVQETAGVATR